MNKRTISLGIMFRKTAHTLWQLGKDAPIAMNLQELELDTNAKLLHIPSVKWRKQNKDLRSNYE
jgi:hypothetical protein